jgi:hypothetical protein
MARQIKRGQGWQLGIDPDTQHFRGLVGGEDWALELTEAEFNDFRRLLVQLTDTVQEIAQELMPEEKFTCEVESDLIWLEAEGEGDRFSLHLIVLTGRRAEGTWSPEAIPPLLQATQTIDVF